MGANGAVKEELVWVVQAEEEVRGVVLVEVAWEEGMEMEGGLVVAVWGLLVGGMKCALEKNRQSSNVLPISRKCFPDRLCGTPLLSGTRPCDVCFPILFFGIGYLPEQLFSMRVVGCSMEMASDGIFRVSIQGLCTVYLITFVFL